MLYLNRFCLHSLAIVVGTVALSTPRTFAFRFANYRALLLQTLFCNLPLIIALFVKAANSLIWTVSACTVWPLLWAQGHVTVSPASPFIFTNYYNSLLTNELLQTTTLYRLKLVLRPSGMLRLYIAPFRSPGCYGHKETLSHMPQVSLY